MTHSIAEAVFLGDGFCSCRRGLGASTPMSRCRFRGLGRHRFGRLAEFQSIVQRLRERLEEIT